MSRSDAEIIQAVVSGDKQAFGDLIQRYWGMVYQVAYQHLSEPMLAEDRAQEAFLQAFLSLEHLQKPEQFRAWLYGITLNLSKNYLRKTAHWENSGEFDESWQTDSPSPESLAEKLETNALLEQAIAQLSQANQDALILYYYKGFSLNEIAELLMISPTAVKGRLHKSRQALKVQLVNLFPSQNPVKGARKMIPVKVVDTPQAAASAHRDILSQILLFNEESRRALVLFLIEEEQVLSIAQLLAAYSPQRPKQHDFAAKLLQATGAKLEYVLLDSIEEGVPFASLALKTKEGSTSIDARRGEAIALALHLNVPIYVSEKSWEKASPPLTEGKSPNRKGIESLIARLDEMRDSRTAWMKQKPQEAANLRSEAAKNFREQAREIIDSSFS